ncbi:MAG: hypothetical protein IJK60_09905 [Clostridia bacterium]|nr:hypothetical protein [Clostridia bacterium]
MSGKYDDIINMPAPVSEYHPQMSMINRAAQFAPFAALTGYYDAIDEMARTSEIKTELENGEQIRTVAQTDCEEPILNDYASADQGD